jgi:hypothetical protein
VFVQEDIDTSTWQGRMVHTILLASPWPIANEEIWSYSGSPWPSDGYVPV